jgi:sporulation protein YlmC with PRC-barrel domain
MRLELGCPIHCEDGPAGELGDVVVDPTRKRVTHLVVQPHRRHSLARLVPVELATGAGDAIELTLTGEELRRLPVVQEFEYLRVGEFPVPDPEWDVGIETVLAQPFYEYSSELPFAGSPLGYDPHVALAYDRVPKGEVEIRRKSDVVSADHHHLGHVDGLVVDGDDLITHVVLEHGHLFGRRDVTIPIGSVAKVATDSVRLALTKDEVDRLPAVRVHRWPGSTPAAA